MFLTEIWNF